MADVAAIRVVIEEARPYDGDLPLFDAATALLALLAAAEARARALEEVAEAARGLWSGWERDGLDYWIDQLGRALAGDGGAA